jgi:nitrite reductase/ring-hydroxylating ferredoxin subunit
LRWRVGHQFFAYCAMHARDAFSGVIRATRAKDAAAATRELERASVFVRALAAAQWYASEFPISCYLAMHGAMFDPRTGAVLRGPAKTSLTTYTVVIDGNDVLIELP